MHVDPGSARPYLRPGWFLVDHGALDVSEVDPSILVIPALGTVLPIAYASGTGVVAEEVDASYAAAARVLAEVWGGVYPRFRPTGFSLNCGERVNESMPGGGQLALFSGGVDSSASLIRRAASVSAVFTVWGADVELSDSIAWTALRHLISRSELVGSRRRLVVRSNFRRFPIEHTLVHDFLEPHDSWWARVQHGMGLIGLAAPATEQLHLAELIIPASYSPAHDEPNGSMPRTDELQRWAGTSVIHDGFELSRLDKLAQLIVPYVAAGRTMELAVCYQPNRASGELNCGRCEKCLRTAAGLIAAGSPPEAAGVVVDEDTYAHWSGVLRGGTAVLDPRAWPFWYEVREALLREPPLGLSPARQAFVRAICSERFPQVFRVPGHVDGRGHEMSYWARRLLPDQLIAGARAARGRLHTLLGSA